MDPLSDVLSLLRARSYMFRCLDAGEQWSLRFPPHEGIRCYAVLSGGCWLIVEGGDEPIRLQAGDCALVTRRQFLRLASDVDLPSADAVTAMTTAPEGGVATLNGGGHMMGLGGFFNFSGQHASVLLALLPPVVLIREEADKVALRSFIEMLMRELRDPRPGSSLVAQHLGNLMLVLALRRLLAEGPRSGAGWLFALADRQLGAAINAMHADPAHRWTLQSLADIACMSRSTFAIRFKDAVGEPAMEYLVRWRMMLAGDKLLNSSQSVSAIAYSLGYESDSAFGAAFRRVMGCSPRQYAARDTFGTGAPNDGVPTEAIRLDAIPE